MANRRNYHPVRRTRERAPSSGTARRLAICLILCAAALGCRLLYPQGIAAMSRVVFGESDGTVRQAFAAFTETLREEGAVEAFSSLYGEIAGRAAD